MVTREMATTTQLADYLSITGMHVARVCFQPECATWQDVALTHVSALCPYVTEIEMPDKIDVDRLNKCIQAWSGLQEIRVCSPSPVVLNTIADGFQQLTALTIRHKPAGAAEINFPGGFFGRVNAGLRHFSSRLDVSSGALLVLATRCNQLRSLLCGSADMTDAVMRTIMEKCPALEAVDLFGCSQLSPETHIALAQAGKLRKLLTLNMAEDVLRLSPALQMLGMLFMGDPSSTLRAIGTHCRDLRELTVYTQLISNEEATAIDETAVAALAGRLPQSAGAVA
jgi:hypothetical protein